VRLKDHHLSPLPAFGDVSFKYPLPLPEGSSGYGNAKPALEN
jgi:hypothetical protein